MKGFVETPNHIVDLMVEKLFAMRLPSCDDVVLDPGAGRGAFIDGILRWCNAKGIPAPRIVGVELDPEHVAFLRSRFNGSDRVTIAHADFLMTAQREFDYVIGNPPYVSIEALSEDEKQDYRSRFECARGRFDLYLLFFEQALRVLRDRGRLVFITPEKFLYVQSGTALRAMLTKHRVAELHFASEATFDGYITYPLISTIDKTAPGTSTRIVDRKGTTRRTRIGRTVGSWQPLLTETAGVSGDFTLGDVALRVSCGVATGADQVFVVRREQASGDLLRFSHPTVSGRELSSHEDPRSVMLVPYSKDGQLLPFEQLGALGSYLNRDDKRSRLMKRTCVAHKPWYAFHETPPLRFLLRPKILCKDIAPAPRFFLDAKGDLVPRHSVYYIVVERTELLPILVDYLNSDRVAAWLWQHSQRAANGYLRLQSHVLKQLPLPKELAGGGLAIQGDLNLERLIA